ncbi:hypothetical protein QBC39DRAFT_142689 [Podospora conica]|nr:hypothetical protein QBC39DRAFT_142689 [Schizothecium conicum]
MVVMVVVGWECWTKLPSDVMGSGHCPGFLAWHSTTSLLQLQDLRIQLHERAVKPVHHRSFVIHVRCCMSTSPRGSGGKEGAEPGRVWTSGNGGCCYHLFSWHKWRSGVALTRYAIDKSNHSMTWCTRAALEAPHSMGIGCDPSPPAARTPGDSESQDGAASGPSSGIATPKSMARHGALARASSPGHLHASGPDHHALVFTGESPRAPLCCKTSPSPQLLPRSALDSTGCTSGARQSPRQSALQQRRGSRRQRGERARERGGEQAAAHSQPRAIPMTLQDGAALC